MIYKVAFSLNYTLRQSRLRTKGLSINDRWVGIDKHTHPPGPLGPWVPPCMHRSSLNNDAAWLVNEMLGTILEHKDQLSTD